MIWTPDERDREALDLYLDDALDPIATRAFESALERAPELRRSVEESRRIDDALRRAFAPPSEDRLQELLPPALRAERPETAPPATPAPFRPAWRTPIGLAAALVLLIGGGWLLRDAMQTSTFEPYHLPEARTIAQAYDETVGAGFEPLWVCADDAEFRDTFRQRLGAPLTVALPASNANVRTLGLDYGNTISPWTIHILTEVDAPNDEAALPVLVFVDRLERDRAPSLADDTELHLFRRELGPLVLYELSPLPDAHVLPFCVTEVDR